MGIEIKTVPPQAAAAKTFRSRERLKQRGCVSPFGRTNHHSYALAFPRWFALTSLLGALGAVAQPTQTVTLAWNPSSDPAVTGYFRYYGGASGAYTNKADVGAATNASVSGLFQGDTYYFTVTAYDASGLESLPSPEISYTVPPATNSAVAPTITGQPTNQTVVAGANAAFLLSAAGTAPLSYQWQFNGAALPNGTNSALTLNNIQPGQAGAYQAIVSNSAGSVTSAVAQLTVLVPPSIVSQPASQTVSVGGTATFQVAANGSTPLNYQWLFNGTALTRATSTSLTLNNVQSSQAGGYSALVSNSAGSVTTAVAQLTVVAQSPPLVTITNPIDGASFNDPATIELDAAVTPNGNSISKIQFYQNSTLLGEAANAPYSLIWSNASAGDYTLTAVAIYSGTNVVSAPIQVHVTGVPPPWQSVDIGTPTAEGAASVSNGVYVVSGAGNLSGSADNFHFLYQTLTGDGSITAQISALSNSVPNGRFGVMIRESLTSGSRYAFMGISTNGKFRFQRRRSTGGSSSATASSLSTLPNTWVRLTRSASTFSGYDSTDGTNWTLVYSGGITMATNPYIGFAVASGNSNVLTTVTFNGLSVVP
ncbi:MAG TPA: immunoglobulin domain-containing protein [Verrucomicrobiae bacterium]|nr:immunoglobulin domain-containing protein [Verrucomicrobiae bacterium]